MAEVSMADLRNLLAAAAEANKATAEAGQVNAERISEINSSLEKLTLAQQEGMRTASKMEMTLERVISANTALDRSVADLRRSMERVATRLTSVEATAAKLSTYEQPSGRRSSHRTQGVGTGEDQTSSRALVKAVTRCCGGDGGVDGGDDGDDDGDDVQLDDDGDGVDFPLREGISPDSCPPESSFLSVLSAPQRRL
ncbi:hypothetical protein QYE76_060153 [Lolium multiflorum]|uniref:Uncharacterized protein n=1 Tax=Lolium multiflorum TaxID=4521 RepID=A0AAD8W3Z6_LOLMU|nr:hypothetical protein QYE76_060153 [Lolium multiflorum]